MKSRDHPFGHSIRSIDGRRIRGFDEMLGDYVDDTFARRSQVTKGVFGIVETACVADDEDRRIVVYHLRIAEGGKVGGRACLKSNYVVSMVLRSTHGNATKQKGNPYHPHSSC